MRRLAACVVVVASISCTGVASAAVTYDRSAAVAYASSNAFNVVSDGYFWVDSGTCKYYGPGVAAPTGTGLASGVGDDCAHFVSSCIGTPSGAGIPVYQPFANSTNATYKAQYGDPSASDLASRLVSSGDASYVTSVSSLQPGDVIAYDWTANGSIDHIVLYIGNNQIAAHATSHYGVNYQLQSGEKMTFIHITLPNAAVPEPAMLGLLGGGTLLTLRRSRRSNEIP